MRLKFQKLPALVLAAAMTLSPMSSVAWADEPAVVAEATVYRANVDEMTLSDPSKNQVSVPFYEFADVEATDPTSTVSSYSRLFTAEKVTTTEADCVNYGTFSYEFTVPLAYGPKSIEGSSIASNYKATFGPVVDETKAPKGHTWVKTESFVYENHVTNGKKIVTEECSVCHEVKPGTTPEVSEIAPKGHTWASTYDDLLTGTLTIAGDITIIGLDGKETKSADISGVKKDENGKPVLVDPTHDGKYAEVYYCIDQDNCQGATYADAPDTTKTGVKVVIKEIKATETKIIRYEDGENLKVDSETGEILERPDCTKESTYYVVYSLGDGTEVKKLERIAPGHVADTSWEIEKSASDFLKPKGENGHDKDGKLVYDNPSCSKEGTYEIQYKCIYCGTLLDGGKGTVPKSNEHHKALEDKIVSGEPKCEEDAEVTYVSYCAECGIELDDPYTVTEKATGHPADKRVVTVEVTKEATCVAGSETVVTNCGVCGKELSSYTRVVPAKDEHKFEYTVKWKLDKYVVDDTTGFKRGDQVATIVEKCVNCDTEATESDPCTLVEKEGKVTTSTAICKTSTITYTIDLGSDSEYADKLDEEDLTITIPYFSTYHEFDNGVADHDWQLVSDKDGVKTYKCSRCGETKEVKDEDPEPAIPAVTGLKADPAGQHTVALTWNAVSNVDGYVVYRRIGLSGEFSLIATISGGSNTKYVDTTAYDGNAFNFYFVMAYVGEEIGPKGDYAYQYGRLPKAENLRATSGKENVTVSWDAVEGADGYIIYTAEGGTTGAGLKFSYEWIVTGTTYVHKNATSEAGQFTYYRVFPFYYNEDGVRIVSQQSGYTFGRIQK